MKCLLVVLVACTLLFALATAVPADPNYIYGIHDIGGEGDMATMGTKGWILDSAAIGHNPNDYSGRDYTPYTNAGYGVIVRLNNGYGSDGTLPYQSEYQNFAQRCANYIANSPGCHIWIIGNETNLPREWPGNINGDFNTGEPITVARYADCYNRVYNAIVALPGHSGDQIIPSPVGTWAPPYPAQGIEPFDDYWVNELNAIGSTKVRGIAVHAYTHGTDPNLVFSNALMGPPYEDIYYNFRVYKNLMNRVPTSMRSKPAYLTETDQDGAWLDSNTGWVRNVYSEINSWNQTAGTQKIRCVILFRWLHAGEGDQYYICDRGNVRADWRQAMTYQYTWTTGSTGTISGNVKDSFNVPLSGASVTTSAGGYSATTDSNGNYTITGVAPATYSTTASKSGYSSQTSNITVTANNTSYGYFTLQQTNGMTPTAPSGSNIALTASATTDTSYSSSYDGPKAKDGTTTTKWCSTNASSTHWLAYDLGANCTVNGYILRNASSGSDGVETNVKNFQIQSASSLSGPWTDEVVVNNSSQAAITNASYTTPKSLRYIRLYITNCGIDNYARIPEFEVRGLADSMNTNTPGGSNIALTATATTDTSYSSSFNGAKAKDGSTSTKWCSTAASSTHWITLDLGSTKTVNGFIARLAGAGGESTIMNLKNFKFQSGTSSTGPWTDECIVDNTAQANVVARSYNTPKALRYVRLYITNCGTDNYARLPEFEIWGPSGGSGSSAENFESMPSFGSSFDASWGNAAAWSIVAGGQSGNFLQAARSAEGSSSKASVYTVPANTNINLSVYLKCPSYAGGTYWMETAYKLGNNTAQDFDGNAGTWTMIQKFANDGTNGNNNTWTQYTTSVNTGSNTQITIGYKLGSSFCVGPAVGWDTLRVN